MVIRFNNLIQKLMNRNLRKLSGIAQKEKRKIIGLMSGTSLDGLDIALCEITGAGKHTTVRVEEFITKPYSEKIQNRLKKITSVETVDLKEICYQHRWLGVIHAKLILEALDQWGTDRAEVDAIASHGQTIYHYPAQDQQEIPEPLHTTLQIADSDTIAVETGIITIGDFRQKHIAHGGEGAPLASYVDNLLFRDSTEPRILLNIGGIANYTYLPPAKSSKKSFTTDTGPGNTLIDRLTEIYFKKPFDRDGEIAESGKVHKKLIEALLSDPWFRNEKSRSTGPEYFNTIWMRNVADETGIDFDDIKPSDLIATATELSGKTIANNMKREIDDFGKCEIYVSGGGAHNTVLIQSIRDNSGSAVIRDFRDLGFDPDAKEALIFAVLANETLAGKGFEFETYSGEKKQIQFGKISFPDA